MDNTAVGIIYGFLDTAEKGDLDAVRAAVDEGINIHVRNEVKFTLISNALLWFAVHCLFVAVTL